MSLLLEEVSSDHFSHPPAAPEESTGSSPVLLANRRAWNREGNLKDSRPFVFSALGLLLRRAPRLQDVSGNLGDCSLVLLTEARHRRIPRTEPYDEEGVLQLSSHSPAPGTTTGKASSTSECT